MSNRRGTVRTRGEILSGGVTSLNLDCFDDGGEANAAGLGTAIDDRCEKLAGII